MLKMWWSSWLQVMIAMLFIHNVNWNSALKMKNKSEHKIHLFWWSCLKQLSVFFPAHLLTMLWRKLSDLFFSPSNFVFRIMSWVSTASQFQRAINEDFAKQVAKQRKFWVRTARIAQYAGVVSLETMRRTECRKSRSLSIGVAASSTAVYWTLKTLSAASQKQ